MSRSTSSTITLLAIATVSACSVQDRPVTPMDAGAARSVSDVSTPSSIGWQAQARGLIASAGMSPLAASRVLAALGVAEYRAIVAIDATAPVESRTEPGKTGYGVREARRGAVAGASARVLSFFFPTAAESLKHRVDNESNSGTGGVHPEFRRGVALGRAVGAAMVDQVLADRFTTPWTGTVPTGPGMWIANGPPAGATFGGVTPYFLTSGAQFRPAPPPPFHSPAFTTDLTEIAAMSANRTDSQRDIALYWNLPTGTHTPVGYWNETTGSYVASKEMNEREAARTFALTNAAMMDALIACWEAKYHYWTIRPSQADSQITLTFGLPNHPSYPSGHSCVSASAATVLSTLFPERTSELSDWVAEAGLSRMYAGIHYRFDITAGSELGTTVGQWALSHEQVLLQTP